MCIAGHGTERIVVESIAYGARPSALELAGDDGIFAVLAEVAMRLDAFLSETAKRSLAEGEYELTVATVRESGRMCVRIVCAEIAFPCRTA